MLIKCALTAIIAGAIGGWIGSWPSSRAAKVEAAGSEVIETREVVLLDDRDRPAARLQYLDGQAVLRFYTGESKTGLELGVDQRTSASFVRMFGSGGATRASLISLPSGDTRLVLGDNRWGSRILLGAVTGDVVTDEPSDTWGLVLPEPSSRKTMFGAVVGSPGQPPRAAASLRLTRGNGRIWSVR